MTTDEERVSNGMAAIAATEEKVHNEAAVAPALMNALEMALGDALMPLSQTHVESRIDRIRVSLLSLRARLMLAESSVRSLSGKVLRSEKGYKLATDALAYYVYRHEPDGANIPLEGMVAFCEDHVLHMTSDKGAGALCVRVTSKKA